MSFFKKHADALNSASQVIGILGGLAGILSGGLAIYALYEPGVAIDFLQKLQKSNVEISENTKEIAGSSKEIEKNTDVIAKNVPFWLNVKSLERNGYGGIYIVYENATNTTIRNASIRFFQGEKQVDELKTVFPPREQVKTKMPTYYEIPASEYTVCVTGTVAATGDTLYERRVYPYNETFIFYDTMKDYEFTDQPTGICAS
ncbi:hypothetical protein [Rhizobium sp. L1K21]|uniref:hypothetical protein n=1 Tax=Rhizobium sp. L1K21 TaxID=2954933 RepID=UPI002092A5B1|nr:hypothetical protein [Rhizobium sp. L1K21]MCO6188346.1 hypothetical protein [Rhizobium sp. L1K21]